MSIGTLLLIFLIVLLVGGLPNWGYHQQGYAPSGFMGVILLIILVLILTGRL